MLIVLAIIATIAGLTLPGVVKSQRTSNVPGLAKEITAQLHSARVSAIATAKPAKILIDPQAGEIRFDDQHLLTLPRDVSMTVTTGLETTIKNRQVVLTFLPNGSASGLEIDLVGKQRARIEVNWLTGLPVQRTTR